MGKSYGDPTVASNVPAGMKLVREALRGEAIPSVDEIAIAKAKAAEREAKPSTFKRAVAQVMRPIQHGAAK